MDKRTQTAAAALAAGTAVVAGKVGLDRLAHAHQDEPDFRLRKKEQLGEGLPRIAQEQLDLVARHLGGQADQDEGDPVHEARKAFKRLRAIARLARDGLGDDTYRRENAAFREMGRRLSGPRDALVLVQTLDAVREDDGASPADEGIDRLREALAQEYADASARLDADKTTIEEALADLDGARARVRAWVLPPRDARALAPGLRRIYSRGRKAYRAARNDPTDETLHELRKRVKDLWHAAQILEGRHPKRMKKLATAAHQLSDYIGDDHDLAVLSEAAASRAQLLDPTRLQELIDRRRGKLQKKALRAARKIYKPKPRAFVKRALA